MWFFVFFFTLALSFVQSNPGNMLTFAFYFFRRQLLYRKLLLILALFCQSFLEEELELAYSLLQSNVQSQQ